MLDGVVLGRTGKSHTLLYKGDPSNVYLHLKFAPPPVQDLPYDSKRLLDFKNDLEDPFGVTANWTNTDLVCSWNGTACRGDRVVSVVIRGGGLQVRRMMPPILNPPLN